MLWSSSSSNTLLLWWLAICICIILPYNSNNKYNSLTDAALTEDYEYYDDDVTEENQAPDLLVSKSPPYFEKNEVELQVQPGSDALLNCDVRNYQVNNVVVWYNMTKMISNGDYAMNERIEILKNNSLRIKNTQNWDAGDYYCTVMPEDIKMHIQLKITAPLAIYYNSQDVTGQTLTFRQDNTETLTCRAAPKNGVDPVIKWSLNGRRAEQNLLQVIDGRLIVNKVDANHMGIYQCLADDGSRDPPHGLVHVDVQYAPKVSTHRHHINTAAGAAMFEVYCDYKANPIAVVHWTRRGRVLGYSEKYFLSNMPHNNRNRSTLTIKDVTKDDLGEYDCQVQNVIGSSAIKVNVGYEPEIPQFEDMKISGRRVLLHWLVRSIQPLSEAVLDYKLSGSYTWSTVSMIHTHRHVQSDVIWKVSHEIELTPGEWHTRVKTRNTAGWSHFSEPHDFELPDDKDENDIDEDSLLPPDELVLSAGIGTAGKPSKNSVSRLNSRSLTSQLFNLCGLLTILIAYNSIN